MICVGAGRIVDAVAAAEDSAGSFGGTAGDSSAATRHQRCRAQRQRNRRHCHRHPYLALSAVRSDGQPVGS